MTRAPIRLGLTGGIGSGKSTVAGMLAALGAGVIDADVISRATTAAHGAAIPLILEQFGAEYITADGALDRERMRQRVFADPRAKARLEAIIHPLVGQQVAEQAKSLAAAGKRCMVFDIPLLVESRHWRTRLDRVLVVDCTPATQSSRVSARNGFPDAQIQQIIATQASRSQRLAAADIVLLNDGISLVELATQVQAIARHFGL